MKIAIAKKGEKLVYSLPSVMNFTKFLFSSVG